MDITKARYFQKVELNKIGGVVFFKKTDTRLYFEYNELGHIYIGYIVI